MSLQLLFIILIAINKVSIMSIYNIFVIISKKNETILTNYSF